MASPSTAVRVLTSILRDEGLVCKGTQSGKAIYLANETPVYRLTSRLQEHTNLPGQPPIKLEETAASSTIPKAPETTECGSIPDNEADTL